MWNEIACGNKNGKLLEGAYIFDADNVDDDDKQLR